MGFYVPKPRCDYEGSRNKFRSKDTTKTWYLFFLKFESWIFVKGAHDFRSSRSSSVLADKRDRCSDKTNLSAENALSTLTCVAGTPRATCANMYSSVQTQATTKPSPRRPVWEARESPLEFNTNSYGCHFFRFLHYFNASFLWNTCPRCELTLNPELGIIAHVAWPRLFRIAEFSREPKNDNNNKIIIKENISF